MVSCMLVFCVCVYQGLSKHQAVGSTLVTEVTKFIVVYWDLPDAIKKVNPERYVSCGSYELFVTNVAHQMYETLCFKITCPLFLIKIISK